MDESPNPLPSVSVTDFEDAGDDTLLYPGVSRTEQSSSGNVDSDLFNYILMSSQQDVEFPSEGSVLSPSHHSGDGRGRKGGKLTKKAQLARESRRKKKEYEQGLERQVKELKAKVKVLEQRTNTEPTARNERESKNESERKEKRKQVFKELADVLQSKGKRRKVLLKGHLDHLDAISLEKETETEMHLDRIEDTTSPNAHLKFALWGLTQEEQFYDSTGLWGELMDNELGLSEDQRERVKALRNSMKMHRERLVSNGKEIQDLRGEIRCLNKLMRDPPALQCLSEEQRANYLIWVEENNWCMQMLHNI